MIQKIRGEFYMKAAVYTKRMETGGQWWGIMSDCLPPGVNQMYNVAHIAGREEVPGEKNKKGRAAFFLSSRASQWKKTVGSIILQSASGTAAEGPYCSMLHLFVFENYDMDNRLKLINDSLQGAVITNDKKIRRSVQMKTVVRKRADIGFIYFIAPQESFAFLLSSFEDFADRLEQENGELRKEYEKKVHEEIIRFLDTSLLMNRRLVCGI